MNLKRLIVASGAVLSMCVVHAETYTWTGGTGDWETPANWTAGGVQAESAPGVNDDVVLPAPADPANNYTVTANAAIRVKSLTIGSTGAAEGCLATFESKTSAMHQIAGDLVVKAGGTMTHAANTTTSDTPAEETLFKLRLSVGGDATIASGVVLDVSGKGYQGRCLGPGKGINNVTAASHGGRGGPDGNKGVPTACYDSIECPTMLGSSSKTSGGGVVRLDITGSFSFDGRIFANGTDVSDAFAGAGGSVWISAASVSGSGMIEANGGNSPMLAYSRICGGGGRVAVTVAAGGFAAWTGSAHAYGGAHASGTVGGCAGTVYLKDGTQQGVVVVDNGGRTAVEPYGADWPSPGYDSAEFFDSVKLVVTNGGSISVASDASVKDIYIENGGRVNVLDGGTLSVSGSFGNRGTISQTSSSLVELIGDDDATISGTPTFQNFSCTVPGKTIRFATGEGNLFAIAAGGSLVLQGAEESLINLCPADDGVWNISVPLTAQANLSYLAVAKSKAAVALTALSSEDRGGNTNWSFPSPISPGDPMTWSADAVDADWFNAENWIDKNGKHRLVVDTDCVTVSVDSAFAPVIAGANVTVQSLTVEEGASLTLAGIRMTATEALTVSGSLTVQDAASVDCYGDVSLNGGCEVGGLWLSLLGAADQEVALGGNSFSRIDVDKDDGTVDFSDGFSAGILQMKGSETTVAEFLSGANYQFGTLFVLGSVDGGRRTELRASSAQSAWNLKVTDFAFCSAVSVSDSDASGGIQIDADAQSAGSDARNVNWRFGANKRVWRGASGDFGTPENWLPIGVPGVSDDVALPTLDGASYTVTANGAIAVKSLTIGSGSANGAVATFESKTSAMHQIVGSLVVKSDGAMTHAANTTTSDTPAEETLFKLRLSVGGDATVEEHAVLDVRGKGYPTRNQGPGKGVQNLCAPSHGGRGGPDGTAVPSDCYGSFESPVTLGSSGVTAGGGVVRLAVVGVLSLDGQILANGGDIENAFTGAGGSIWISATAISGSGVIEANGGVPSQGYTRLGGGGGRIAVTVAAGGFVGWTGDIHAYGGAHPNGTIGGCAGTIYRKDGAYGVVIVDNNGKSVKESYGADIPSQNSDSMDFFRSLNLVLSNGGAVTLTQNLKINDINLAASKAVLNLNQYVLTVMSGAHKNGKHWAPDASVTSKTVEGVTGEIIWPSGLLISIK